MLPPLRLGQLVLTSKNQTLLQRCYKPTAPMAQSVESLGYEIDDPRFELRHRQVTVSSPKRPDPSAAHLASGGSFPGKQSGRG